MLTYRIDPPRRLVTLTASGALTVADVAAMKRRLLQDPDFDPAFALLADFRASSLWQFRDATLRSSAANTPFAPRAPRAFVVGDALSYGLLRMFQTFTEQRQGGLVKVFRDADAAMRWIRQMQSIG